MTEPAVLRRIAKNYLEWCKAKDGSAYAKARLASLFDAETIISLKPHIEDELRKRGWNVPIHPPTKE